MTPAAVLTERTARMALARIAEPGDRSVTAAVAEHGSVELIQLLRTGQPRSLAERLRPRLDKLERIDDVAILASLHASVLIPGDPQWPTGLDDLDTPPHCLWVRGDPELDLATAMKRSVAMVGARAATAYGLTQAGQLAGDLVDRRFTVVSGAAFGIDAAAHNGALAADGVTVAVLACGIDRAYPLAHRSLIDTIGRTGAVVTELPPGAAPYRQRFLQRNRLIAAMTSGTVVVEAALRSGSLQTASCAANLGRPVGALPGPVTSMASSGCHRAIRDQLAVLVTDADEIADLLGRFGADAVEPSRAEIQPGDDLPAAQRAVWEVLPTRYPATIEALAERCALDQMTVAAALGPLELAGLAARAAGDRWRRARPEGR